MTQAWTKVSFRKMAGITLLLKLLPNAVLFVRAESIVTDHLALQTGQHKLHAENHEQNAHEQQRLVVNRFIDKEAAADYDDKIYQQTQQERPEAQRDKKAQRIAQEGRQKQHVEQIDQATRKTPHPIL